MQFCPAAQKAPETRVLDGALEVAVLADDDGSVGAELHADLLEPGLLHDLLARRSAAGEADHPHARVGDEGVPGLRRVAGHDVEDARRKPRLHERPREHERRERGHGRRLHDDGVPRRDRRADLVRDEVQRIVERRDRRDDRRSGSGNSSRRGSPSRGANRRGSSPPECGAPPRPRSGSYRRSARPPCAPRGSSSIPRGRSRGRTPRASTR